MIVRCKKCGASETFHRAAVSHPPSMRKRAAQWQQDAADAWLARPCSVHAVHAARALVQRRRSKHKIAESFQMDPTVNTTVGPFVLRSDCTDVDCCGGTKLWLCVGKTLHTDPRFTADPKLAMRFVTIGEARDEVKRYRVYRTWWRKTMGYAFRDKRMKIMRRTRRAAR